MKRVIFLIMVVLFMWTTHAVACSFDTDCSPGSRCIKSPGNIYGVCMGGLFPGNKNDSTPVYAPTDPNRTYGNTCTFDTDCGPGSKCLKGSGIEGTCIKSW
jgi:hypothetical protein